MDGHTGAVVLNVLGAVLNGLMYAFGRNRLNLICMYIGLGAAIYFAVGTP